MGSEWHGEVGGEPIHDDKGEMCVEHRTVLRAERNGAGFVAVACRTGCPARRPNRG